MRNRDLLPFWARSWPRTVAEEKTAAAAGRGSTALTGVMPHGSKVQASHGSGGDQGGARGTEIAAERLRVAWTVPPHPRPGGPRKTGAGAGSSRIHSQARVPLGVVPRGATFGPLERFRVPVDGSWASPRGLPLKTWADGSQMVPTEP